jgi:hypothetical protein
MTSSRPLLTAFLFVAVGCFLIAPPSIPAWLRFTMGKDNGTSTTSVALGISLTAKYGIVSVRHPDGSFKDVGRTEGSQKYRDMMRRFSLTSSSHLAYVFLEIYSEDMLD